MKTRILLAIFTISLFSGCESQSSEQQRLEHIAEVLKTREVWWNEQHSYYVVRAADGSVWIVERNSLKKVEDLTKNRIFVPILK